MKRVCIDFTNEEKKKLEKEVKRQQKANPIAAVTISSYVRTNLKILR